MLTLPILLATAALLNTDSVDYAISDLETKAGLTNAVKIQQPQAAGNREAAAEARREQARTLLAA